MEVKINFSTENAAFEGNGFVIEWRNYIAPAVERAFERGADGAPLFDSNGNKIGEVAFGTPG